MISMRSTAKTGVALFFSALCLVIVRPATSFADAATHELTLAASTLLKVDCGGGTCTTACSIQATLANVSHSSSHPISVKFPYATKVVDGGIGYLSFYFPTLSPGHSASTRDEALGFVCSKMTIKDIVIDCPEERDSKCPGFYYVQIPANHLLKIKRRKVEGR